VDTGAIEGLYTTDRGFTRTIATQSEFWERALEQRGEHVSRSIGDAIDGYEYVLDAVTGKQPITEKWIRELHAVITEHQESIPVTIRVGDEFHDEDRPLLHGQYKQLPNNPTNRSTGEIFYYAPPEDTPIEMARLISELNSAEFLAAHHVVQAAYAHYAYIRIHPFQDGNGRVARALASVYLYRDPGVPLVVFADQRNQYLDSLEAADTGNPTQFVEFITQRVIDTTTLVVNSMVDPDLKFNTQTLKAEAAIWQRAESLNNAAKRLQELSYSALRQAAMEAGFPDAFKVAAGRRTLDEPILIDGYSVADGSPGVGLAGITARNGEKQISQDYAIEITSGADLPELIVAAVDGSSVLDVWLRNLEPSVSTVLQLEIETWARTAVIKFGARLMNEVQDSR
jgi:Fic family protein